MAGMPKVFGAIDGTHIKIAAPHEDPSSYFGRKTYPTINVQVVCDPELNFINVLANYPGSTHDARILRESHLFEEFDNSALRPFDGILLGDSAYPTREWLLPPFNTPTTRSQRRFNTSHKKTRVKIENSIGVMKRR